MHTLAGVAVPALLQFTNPHLGGSLSTTLAFLFFPAASGVIIVLALIFADGNPWARREVPILEQLAAQAPAELQNMSEWTAYQADLDSAIAVPAVRR